ncbi:MAG: hypothetical protein QM599_10470 [Pseudoxanthomonas sp.]
MPDDRTNARKARNAAPPGPDGKHFARYLWQAFNARPLGMPIPPNWIALAAVGLAGVFVSPGFLLIGAALEGAYLYLRASNPRFRNAVDAMALKYDPEIAETRADQRYRDLLDPLPAAQRQQQRDLEQRARAIMALLDKSPMMAAHADSLEQLVWLHLRLLSARSAIAGVVDTARQQSAALIQQEQAIQQRLAAADVGEELRRSLQQQQNVIDQRQAAHASAARRLEQIDSELQRIDQQTSLLREQALLSTDETSLGGSLDALAASFSEANRWLDSQRDLLGVLDLDTQPKLPAGVLRAAAPPPLSQGESA